VSQGGTALVQDGVVVAGNSSDGLHLWAGADVRVQSGLVVRGERSQGETGPVTVEGNKGNGIFMRTNAVGIFSPPAARPRRR
jgi:hypothetical protein